MRGSISRRGDSWRVHVYLGLDSQTSKQRYLTRTVHGTTRGRAGLHRAGGRGRARRLRRPSAVTFAELVARWLEHLKPNVSPATLAAYKNYMRKWTLPALGPKKLERIRPVDLDLFYASLRPHLAGASVRTVHTLLHSTPGAGRRRGEEDQDEPRPPPGRRRRHGGQHQSERSRNERYLCEGGLPYVNVGAVPRGPVADC